MFYTCIQNWLINLLCKNREFCQFLVNFRACVSKTFKVTCLHWKASQINVLIDSRVLRWAEFSSCTVSMCSCNRWTFLGVLFYVFHLLEHIDTSHPTGIGSSSHLSILYHGKGYFDLYYWWWYKQYRNAFLFFVLWFSCSDKFCQSVSAPDHFSFIRLAALVL